MRDNLVPGRTSYQKRRRRGRSLAKKADQESLPDAHLARRCRPVEKAKFCAVEQCGRGACKQKDLGESDGKVCTCTVSCEDDRLWRDRFVKGAR